MIIGICTILFVIAGMIWSIPSKNETEEQTKKTETKNKEAELTTMQVNATVYSGTWLSNREDEMVIELNKKAHYTASTSSWLTTGTYRLDGDTIIFSDDKLGEKKFQLQTRMGSTVLYLKEGNEEIFLYPNQEVKKQLEKEYADNTIAVKNLISQKWLDVLYGKPWTYKADDIESSLQFEEGKFTQTIIDKKTDKKEVHEYTYHILDQESTEEYANLSLAVLDVKNNEARNISITLSEEKVKYTLSSLPGTFKMQNSYEKSLSDVQLTQAGNTRTNSALSRK